MAIARNDNQTLLQADRRRRVHRYGKFSVRRLPSGSVSNRADEVSAVACAPDDLSRLTPMERRALERLDEHTKALRAARKDVVETR